MARKTGQQTGCISVTLFNRAAAPYSNFISLFFFYYTNYLSVLVLEKTAEENSARS